jgi:serine/threonine-protein kinase
VYDWGTIEDTAFLVMQYVPGADLRQVLRQRGPLPEPEALRLAADVAAALEAAHRHGIVHRDVKPRNVLVDPGGAALLTDFGIAASTHGTAAEPEAVYGTALYVSPEQAQGRRVDGRADVYSLGAMLYELLTGQPPFRGQTPEDTARQHLQATVRPPRRLRPGLSAATERAVLRALEKDPARRFGTAARMREALLAAAAQSGRRSATHPTASALTRPALRWVLAGAPLVVLLLVGVPTLARARQASVPALAGQSVDAARQAVTGAGLTLDVQEQPTLDTPAGVIVSQDPQADALTAAGSTVHALVSSGVRVPDLSGQQCAAARAAVERAGWTLRPVRWRIANVADFGKIVAQEPAPGSVVPSKGQINVQVAGPVRPC